MNQEIEVRRRTLQERLNKKLEEKLPEKRVRKAAKFPERESGWESDLLCVWCKEEEKEEEGR